MERNAKERQGTVNGPVIGSLVQDTKRSKVGRVMDDWGGRLQFRPPNGGLEWEVQPSDVVALDEESL